MASKENVLIITATILAFLIIACQKHCIPMTYALTGGISTFNPDKDSIRVVSHRPSTPKSNSIVA